MIFEQIERERKTRKWATSANPIFFEFRFCHERISLFWNFFHKNVWNCFIIFTHRMSIFKLYIFANFYYIFLQYFSLKNWTKNKQSIDCLFWKKSAPWFENFGWGDFNTKKSKFDRWWSVINLANLLFFGFNFRNIVCDNSIHT